MFETVLLATSKVGTFVDGRPLTTGSGFFFERDERLPGDEPSCVHRRTEPAHAEPHRGPAAYRRRQSGGVRRLLDTFVSRWQERVAPGRGQCRADRCRRHRDRPGRASAERGLPRIHAATYLPSGQRRASGRDRVALAHSGFSARVSTIRCNTVPSRVRRLSPRRSISASRAGDTF